VIRVEVEQGELRGLRVERAEQLTIGRAPSNDLHLPDWHVSGNHAVLLDEGDRVRVRDLKSTNGSRIVRGTAVIVLDESCHWERELEPGDRLSLGDASAPVLLRVDWGARRSVPNAEPSAAPHPAPPSSPSPQPSYETSGVEPRGLSAASMTIERAVAPMTWASSRAIGAIEPHDDSRVVAVRPVASIDEARLAVEADPVSLKAVYEAGRRIGAALELDAVLDAISEAVFALVSKATHLTIVLRDESPSVDGGAVSADAYAPVTTRVRGHVGVPTQPVPVARSVFRRVLSERAAVLAADAQRDMSAASILGASILSTMAVPLWKGDEILGVLEVDNRDSPGIFRERDLDLLTVVAANASLAVANARLYRRLLVAEQSARAEAGYLKQKAQKRIEGIIGESAAMRAVFASMQKVIDTRVTVLIEGETGTGKERVASAIHYQSRRREKLFVAQNCAAMPETLLESELFGHKRGAFTGADADKKGLFELADGGTLFLDEIGEMPLALQSKLLRVLQEGEVRPLGASTTRTVDVRIVAATNRKLEEEVKAGRFRQDLYYRLQVFPLRLPPLRERRDDIPLLARHFLDRYAREMGKNVAGFSQQALELLMSYSWPGNVRELENEVQRLVIQLDPGSYVMPHDLSPRVRNVEGVLDKIRPPRGTLKDMIEHIEKWLLIEALREHGGNKSATAKTLGITREGLHKKLKGYGIG
jgi:transcriptional regulator with GAF, ATPase, and Fis domain/pSer/pThr/pTyr-binding forkhead associated (FHA) protein